jgi:membrane fusion protein (multidrug efflux system)
MIPFRPLAMLAAFAMMAGCGNSNGQASGATTDSGAGGGSGGGGAGAGRGPGGFDPNRVIPVEISIAERGPITRTTLLTGVVEPIRRVGVNSQLAGAVLSVSVEEGSVVRRDQVLARIDARELDLQLISANAALAAARSAMERAEKMRKAQIYTDIEYERDRTALAAAQSQVDQLQTRLGYANVKAPLDGIVVEKRIEAGDIVGSQTRLFSVADVSALVVRVQVSELEVGGLSQGQPVEIAIDAIQNQSVGGRIRRIFPTADSASRLVPVEVELTGAGVRSVKPGYLVRATFTSSAKGDALLIPASAIVISAGASAVYLVKEGRAKRTNVRTGLNYSGRIEILDGVVAGDTVIVAGNIAVRDGAAVRVVPAALGDSVPPASRAQLGSGRGNGDE